MVVIVVVIFAFVAVAIPIAVVVPDQQRRAFATAPLPPCLCHRQMMRPISTRPGGRRGGGGAYHPGGGTRPLHSTISWPRRRIVAIGAGGGHDWQRWEGVLVHQEDGLWCEIDGAEASP
jgi:hypothetical protein